MPIDNQGTLFVQEQYKELLRLLKQTKKTGCAKLSWEKRSESGSGMLEARVNDDDKTTIMNIVQNNLEEMKKKFDGKGFSVANHAHLSFGNKLHITVIREEELQKWTSQRILHPSSSVNRENNIKFSSSIPQCLQSVLQGV